MGAEPDAYRNFGQGGPTMSHFLITLSPCRGDFTSPEAHLVGGKFVNTEPTFPEHSIYTQRPEEFATYLK
jgi:hypothetical protein